MEKLSLILIFNLIKLFESDNSSLGFFQTIFMCRIIEKCSLHLHSEVKQSSERQNVLLWIEVSKTVIGLVVAD